MKTTRILLIATMAALVADNLSFGQQWQGAQNTTGNISRIGNVTIGANEPTTFGLDLNAIQGQRDVVRIGHFPRLTNGFMIRKQLDDNGKLIEGFYTYSFEKGHVRADGGTDRGSVAIEGQVAADLRLKDSDASIDVKEVILRNENGRTSFHSLTDGGDFNKTILTMDHATGDVSVKVLNITGGGDLAEPFGIEAKELIEPGMVVAINPDRPGQLRIADKAYDHRVAGIISGANGVNPGLTMKQEGTVADGSFPVSLTGRVYCWADASYSVIEPGDLLTTSDTFGHAMKVTDHAKAQGAVIGKAMSSLKEGKGLVLVLVSLQ